MHTSWKFEASYLNYSSDLSMTRLNNDNNYKATFKRHIRTNWSHAEAKHSPGLSLWWIQYVSSVQNFTEVKSVRGRNRKVQNWLWSAWASQKSLDEITSCNLRRDESPKIAMQFLEQFTLVAACVFSGHSSLQLITFRIMQQASDIHWYYSYIFEVQSTTACQWLIPWPEIHKIYM